MRRNASPFYRKVKPIHLVAAASCLALSSILWVHTSGKLKTPLQAVRMRPRVRILEIRIAEKAAPNRKVQEAAGESLDWNADDRANSIKSTLSPKVLELRAARRKQYLRKLVYPSRPVAIVATDFLKTSSAPSPVKTFKRINISGFQRRKKFLEADLLESLETNCSFVKSLRGDQLVEVDDEEEELVMPFSEYKTWKSEKFISEFSTPFELSPEMPELPLIYPSYVEPEENLFDPEEVFNKRQIKKELRSDKLRRLSRGDDDLLKIPEIVQAMSRKSSYKVPNIVHFVYFGCFLFRIDQYMALIGAYRYQRPEVIVFHTDCEPYGDYWEAIRAITGKRMIVVKRSPPERVWGNEIEVVEHKSDVTRLQVMMEVGGIYLDLDSIVLRSMDDLRRHTMVLGEESEIDLANGIILAHKDAWFLRRWYWEYKYFQDDKWALNSCLVPWTLWQLFPSKIHVVTRKMVRPNWDELDFLYRDIFDWTDHYTMHLYTSKIPDWDAMPQRSLKEMAILETTYGQIARHVIWGSKEVRDITNWIVTCNLTQRLIRLTEDVLFLHRHNKMQVHAVVDVLRREKDEMG